MKRLDLPCEDIIKLYNNNKSLNYIGRIYNCSGATISRCLRECDIEIRSHSESQIARFVNPMEREKIKVANEKRFEDPNECKKISDGLSRYFKIPGMKEKQSEILKKYFTIPENRTKSSIEHIEWYKNHPEVRIRISCNQRGISIEDFDGFMTVNPYCNKFNDTKKIEIRNKYNNCDYLTGIHRDVCNRTKSGKIRELDVHHVDYNKMQGCDDHKWKLIPVSATNHKMFNRNRPFWEKLIIYALEYDREYYK